MKMVLSAEWVCCIIDIKNEQTGFANNAAPDGLSPRNFKIVHVKGKETNNFSYIIGELGLYVI